MERSFALTRRMTAKEARDNFTDLLGIVYYSKEPVIVEKKGRPFAVVISPEDYELIREAAQGLFFKAVREIQQDNQGVDPDEVMRDVTVAVEEVRRSHYEEER